MNKNFAKIGAVLYCAAIVVATVCFTIRDANRNLKNDIVIEAGSEIRIEDFFERCPEDAKFLTDVSGIDTNEPAVYQLKVFYDEVFEKDVILRIEDHTAPRAIALPKLLYTTWKAPDATDCVGYLYDLSGIGKIEYKQEPVFREGGIYNVDVLVTDVYGNTATIDVPFTVIDDHTGPVIRGVKNLEVEANQGEPDFFDGVTVSDDYDDEPMIRIDDSEVDYSTPGVYKLRYEAIDKANNVSSRYVEITVKPSTKAASANTSNDGYDVSGSDTGSGGSVGNVSKNDAKRLASKIMSGLWGKNDVETARNIFNWVHSHISYVHCGSLSYAQAAYRGFSRRSGDCYVFYSCCKMLLDQAGIPNMMVKRYPVYGSNHYWNLVKLNGQWYHCDATRFRHRGSIYFMCTDAQINDKYHQFNGKLYPARAGGSTDFKPSDTPTPTDDPTLETTTSPTSGSASLTPTTTGTPEPTGSAEPTSSVVGTPTPTSGASQESTGTPTPTDKPEGDPTNTPTSTPAEKPSNTPTNTPTSTPVPKPTDPPQQPTSSSSDET